MKISRTAKIIFSILSSSLILIFIFGHGCGSFHTDGIEGLSTGAGQLDTTIIPIQGAKTTSTIYSKQSMDNFLSCTGLSWPTAKINEIWEDKSGSISEDGFANKVNSPMMMATIAIAGEVCNEVIEIEALLAPNQRRLFNSLDFSTGPFQNGDNALSEVVRRIARSCWMRNESQEELDEILFQVNQSMSTNDPIETRNAALMICTGMLSSLSAISL